MTTCSVDDFPFKYFDTNGDVINGTLTNGSCIFPDANCGANLPASGCCDLNKDFVSTSPGETIMTAVNNVWMIPLIVVGMGLWKSMSEEEKEELKKEGIESQPKFIRESKLSKGMKKFLTHWWYNGIFISIIGAIFLGIYLKRTEQSSMTTVERTSLMSAEAFFDPFYTAFTFVDDIIMIRVTYALANNDKLLTNRLIHMGLVGVTITGIAGGIVATILGLSQTTLQLLTNPGRENDLALYPGCEFIGNIDTNLIVPYWMMEAWGCWGQQIGRVFAGFLTGAGEIALMGWIGSIGTGIFAAIWFPNYRTFGNPLTLLGIAEITMDWLLPMIYVLVLVATPYGKQIGERTGLELSFQKIIHYFIVPSRAIWRKITNQPKDTKTNTDNKTNITASKAIRTAAAEANAADYSQGGESEENKNEGNADPKNDKEKVFAISDDEVVEEVFTLVKQGIALMFVDLVSLAAGSATTFLALNADNAVAYQLTALASELPNYGLVATGTMVMMLKLLGPYLLGNHDPKWFVQYCYLNLISSVVVVGFVLGCTFPFLDKLAFNSGKNACAFATSTECLPYFNEVRKMTINEIATTTYSNDVPHIFDSHNSLRCCHVIDFN